MRKLMKARLTACIATLLLGACTAQADNADGPAEVVTFQNGTLELKGELFKPAGTGPFPAVLYNHGSAPGMLNSQASKVIGPMFAKMGWVFFMPYRRGQGLSEKAGPYVSDEISSARKHGGVEEAAKVLAQRMDKEHFSDQAAALTWLQSQPYVKRNQIASAGNSFGGIQAILGAQRLPYCAVVDASGGAESWDEAPPLQALMLQAAKGARAPVLLFQAANDFSLKPSQALAEQMKAFGHLYELKIYPAFGLTAKDGHSFAYRGASTWFKDVLAFLQANCTPRSAQSPPAPMP